MASRHMPVRPNLEHLRHQANDLLRAFQRDESEAIAEFREYNPATGPLTAELTDAQFVLARSYGLSDWPRLVTACHITDAIWRGDVEAVRTLVLHDPRLLVEDARGVEGNWGPPMSYAANLGQDAIIEMLSSLGAQDWQHAFGRACLQGHVETARRLHALIDNPRPLHESLDGPAYTLNVSGTELLFQLGARATDEAGNRLAPVATVLETDSRNPVAKHRILELYEEHGLRLPDTPTMALQRGRIDLLEQHLQHDPRLLSRTFPFADIYPPELGCSDEVGATYGTPLAGATLLHMCADYGEIEIARWLLLQGMQADTQAEVDTDEFGGHTPLFSTIVSQANFRMNHNEEPPEAPLTRLLLEHGANPNARASLRKQLHPGYGIDGLHVYRNVTPIGWGEEFVFQKLVNRAGMRLIAEYGGQRR
ncbi:ankyrin repeat domain-containing protein [Granulicella arctica]|uniref:ankyrin repeat domain-containing protein n=1 Tax=Granulicella arctica TaxID=940613 RepID=UPI0021DF6CF0|nr:ankyrin repeat domain-containing protein [Granulicella arctica]